MAQPKLNLIAAVVDSTFGIGKDNKLPWHLPNEYSYFAKMTTRTSDPSKQNAVILGRNCWYSIPQKFRPLLNRVNVLLSRTLKEPPHPEGPPAHKQEVKWRVQDHTAMNKRSEYEPTSMFTPVYAAGLRSPLMNRLYLTKIFHPIETDVFFPSVEWEDFEEVPPAEGYDGVQEEKGIIYKFCVYQKKQPLTN